MSGESPCIDCGQQRAVMLVQTATLGKVTKTWRICVPCWRARKEFEA
jgi:hypothetical protein